jgi:hypothetical protein
MPASPTRTRLGSVLLRMALPADDFDLRRLAALDSAPPLLGPVLVAEKEGAIVAALCLSTGRAVADPFARSLRLVDLLRRYAARRARPRHRLATMHWCRLFRGAS